MKKMGISLITAVLVLLALQVAPSPVGSAAADAGVTVYVDGQEVMFPDAPAYIDRNNRTQLPARYISQALGAETEWDPVARKASFSLELESGVTRVDFYIDSDIYYITSPPNSLPEQKTMDTKAVIEMGRTYVPVRYLAEALGAAVWWEAASRTLHITSSPQRATQSDPATQKVEDMYDSHGLMLAPYANVFFRKWFDSVRLTYSGETVVLSYTVPEGIPEDAELSVTLMGVRTDETNADGPGWMYETTQRRAGHRENGTASQIEYLIPGPVNGQTRKELRYIPLKDISFLSLHCMFHTPPGAAGKDAKNYAQSEFRVVIDTTDLSQSLLEIRAYDWGHAELKEYHEDIHFDGAQIVKA